VVDRVVKTVAKSSPNYRPTARELRIIEAGRTAFRRGDYITLDEYLDEPDDSEAARRK